MDLTHTRRRRQSLLIQFMTLGVAIGAIYGTGVATIMDETVGRHTFFHGSLRGAFTGLVVSGIIAYFELYVVEGANGLRRRPFWQLLAIKEVVYITAILGGDWLGSFLFNPPGSPGFGWNRLTAVTFVFSVGFALLINFIMEMSMLLGPGVLGNMMRGRYHQPRLEQRLLVFFDMRSSTAIAEKIGDIAFHSLLNRFFTDLTEPVLAWGGTVHKYVGDEMIVTWPLNSGKGPAGAYAAVLEARERFAQLGPRYQQDFGVAPDFRAILHAGPIVAGEMGEVKREIVLLGDTINTTAKIEQVTKGLSGAASIASAEALAMAKPPAGITSRSLGSFTLPGKSTAVELYSIN